MIGLFITYTFLVDDLLKYWATYKLRREARNAADRLANIIQKHHRQEANKGG